MFYVILNISFESLMCAGNAFGKCQCKRRRQQCQQIYYIHIRGPVRWESDREVEGKKETHTQNMKPLKKQVLSIEEFEKKKEQMKYKTFILVSLVQPLSVSVSSILSAVFCCCCWLVVFFFIPRMSVCPFVNLRTIRLTKETQHIKAHIISSRTECYSENSNEPCHITLALESHLT